ncbi:RDD family protein [Tenacibaculum sp. 190524A05c]|uniref:RDD domain-containing protein n=1 Tax=Tenacibaculum platacis TaxID=3137852 RepID=A0ABM9P5N4_9FLAO
MFQDRLDVQFEEFENIYKEPELASIFTRLIAAIIDIIVYWMICVAMSLVAGENNGLLNYSVEGFPALLLFGIAFFLWPISEGVYGQTIGKRLLDIKVIANNEKEMTIAKGFIRYFLGIIDWFFCVGIIIALIDKKNQRLGDIIADTIVVKSEYKPRN